MKHTLCAFFGAVALGFSQTYQESGGLVVMEMENTSSSLGLWEEQSSLSGYSGDGYLRFLGNTFETGPATSPQEFNFTINQAGLYYLHLHCAKETHDGRTDVANDCYVRVEGDYNAGPGPHAGHGDNASLSLLQNDTKYFGGTSNNWKWENGQNSSGGNGNLDPGGHENKRVAVYDFKAGETYKLVVSGRSKFFRINRIVFRHTSTASNTAQNLNTPESSTSGGGGGESYVYDATEDFPDTTSGDIDYYKDNGNDVLAIAAQIVANRTGFARASRTFDGVSGSYDVTITTMTEYDGESTYRLLVNGAQVATFQNPFVLDPPNSPLDLQPHTHTWAGINIPNGATIAIESNADSNDQVSEAVDGNPPWAWARGRWSQLELSSSNSLIRPPAGRLAIVADGNSPDPDDIGATAVMFGILNRSGLNDRLVHLSHSCDLDPFRNGGSQSIDAPNELRRQNKLHALCGEGVGFYGPYPNLADYYNCRTEQTAAVNDLRDAINASSASDPLWIVEAGEPDVIGYALQAATASKRQHVHIISHHPANDNSGDVFTWAEILAFGITEHQIGDQNVGLQVLISSGLWDWAENHSDAGIAWIWNQLKYAEQDGVVGFQTNKYDCSDAGMVYWWLTGATNGGNRNSTPNEMRALLLQSDPEKPVAHWKLDEGSGGIAADASGNGYQGTLMNGATWGSDATRSSYVSFDGTDDRISTTFTYALASSDDFTWAWWANQQSTGTTDQGAIMLGNRYPQPGGGGETYEFIKLTPTHAQFANTDVVGDIERHTYATISQGDWHHYALVKDGTSCQWYVDGVAQGSPVTMSYNEDSPLPFLIGGDDNGTGKVNEHFEGFIDDVVLYRRALDGVEVLKVRNGNYGKGDERTGAIPGLDYDADVRDDLVVVNLGSDLLVPGRSGAAGGFNRASVFVFEIPDFGAIDDPFTEASFRFNVETVSSAPPGVDLYGLGRRSSPEVVEGDYYGESATLDSSDATLIQRNLLNAGTGTGVKESSASAAFVSYLNEQYAGGESVGDFLFLRLSTNAPISGLQRHFVTSSEGASIDDGIRPTITYTAIAVGDFDSWLGLFDFSNGADLTVEGDPDRDGLNTWSEYLFGLDPSDSSSNSPFLSNLSPALGTFSYTRRNPSLTGGVEYQIWVSEDLQDWDQDEEALQIPDEEYEIQEVVVSLADGMFGGRSVFVRVVAIP